MKKKYAPAGSHMRIPVQIAILSVLAGINAASAQGPVAPVQPPAAQAVDGERIAEVIVTVTKRSTALQKTPVAITAISAATLEDNHVQTLLDVGSHP